MANVNLMMTWFTVSRIYENIALECRRRILLKNYLYSIWKYFIWNMKYEHRILLRKYWNMKHNSLKLMKLILQRSKLSIITTKSIKLTRSGFTVIIFLIIFILLYENLLKHVPNNKNTLITDSILKSFLNKNILRCRQNIIHVAMKIKKDNDKVLSSIFTSL